MADTHDTTARPSDAPTGVPSATRDDLQLGRRLFHLLNGVTIATAYAILFTHEQVVRIFGTIACVVYIADRIRIAYPEVVAQRAAWVNRLFLRAEEEVREAAMTPFAIAVLLTIITVPKPAALVAIYTLGIADPLAAVIGIRFGRHRITRHRSLEGTAAFFTATVAIAAAVLARGSSLPPSTVAAACVTIGAVAAVCEVIPVRVDDNLTIPLFVGFATWLVAVAFGIALV